MLSDLLFLGSTTAVISYLFRTSSNKSTSLIACLVVILLGTIIKLSYDYKDNQSNYYSILQVNRASSPLDIRQSYKKISKLLHPDKNPSPEAKMQFQKVKEAYDILMDEQQKDLYDRFGAKKLNFDPRKDELKLLSDIAFRYIYWFVLVYVITIPETSRASRTWDIFVCIGMMIAEVTLCLTESKLPTQVPFNMTEFEVIELLHALCPTLIALLSVVAEYVFVDVDKQCALLLSFLAQQQRDIDTILLMLTPMIEEMTGEVKITPETLNITKDSISELQDKIRLSQRATATSIDVLKNSNSNFLSKYYWVIFVLMYFGVYLFQ